MPILRPCRSRSGDTRETTPMTKNNPGQKPPVVAVQFFTAIQSHLPTATEFLAKTASPRIPTRVRAAIRSLVLLVLAPLAVVFDRGMRANAESKIPATRTVDKPVALPSDHRC